MNRSRTLYSLILIFLLSSPLSTSADASQAHVTGFFSDMHYSPDSGDVSGMEVWIVYGLRGYYAVIQVAEGMPQTPVVVAAEVDGSVVRFVYPTQNMCFKGQITNAGLVGYIRRRAGRPPAKEVILAMIAG